MQRPDDNLASFADHCVPIAQGDDAELAIAKLSAPCGWFLALPALGMWHCPPEAVPWSRKHSTPCQGLLAPRALDHQMPRRHLWVRRLRLPPQGLLRLRYLRV